MTLRPKFGRDREIAVVAGSEPRPLADGRGSGVQLQAQAIPSFQPMQATFFRIHPRSKARPHLGERGLRALGSERLSAHGALLLKITIQRMQKSRAEHGEREPLPARSNPRRYRALDPENELTACTQSDALLVATRDETTSAFARRCVEASSLVRQGFSQWHSTRMLVRVAKNEPAALAGSGAGRVLLIEHGE